MMFKSLLQNVLMGPGPKVKSLRVDFYLIGGQVVSAYNVRSIETSKTSAGGFASYKIVWADGKTPDFFSLTLDHISAITSTDM